MFWEQLSKPFVLAVVALLVGVVVLVFFPFVDGNKFVITPQAGSSTVVLPLPNQEPTTVAIEKPVTAETSISAPILGLAISAPPAPVERNADFLSSVLPTAAPAALALPVTVPASGSTNGMLVLTARGPSWVEVVDAARVVQVRKIMAGGEVVAASGVAPLAVVVGRADAIEVLVRGQPFDLVRIAKDNVARFEVK